MVWRFGMQYSGRSGSEHNVGRAGAMLEGLGAARVRAALIGMSLWLSYFGHT